MKKIISLMLITFNIAYSNAPKSCKVLQAPYSDGIAFSDVNKTIKSCKIAIKDYPNKVQYWYELGSAYSSNSNSEEALHWYLKAAEKGHATAQYNIGTMYSYGASGIKVDKEKAISWYLKAAENNSTWAQREVGNMYQQGEGVKKDIKTALFWYIKSADLNNSDSQRHLGDMYYEGKDVEEDYTKAMSWYMKAAENSSTWRWNVDGDILAQNKIADMYYDGIGVQKDYKKAFKWFMRAAKQGNRYAQYSIGYMYINGEWATKNLKKAYTWISKAAEGGHIGAQKVLANMYEHGIGVKKNIQKSFSWNLKAATKGLLDAQISVARAYYFGVGTRKSYKKAFDWYMKAAKQGDAQSQGFIGLMYAEGEGIKKNNIKAYSWYSTALSQYSTLDAGYDNLHSLFNGLEKRMTPAEISIAQNYDPLSPNEEVENKPVGNKMKSSQRYTGTGFFVDKSTVLTNHHVVKNCNSIELVRKGYKSIAKIKAKDSVNDLAILEADKVSNSSLNFRAGKGIRIGDDIIVIGYPLGELLGTGIKLTTGNISALTGLINDTTSMQLTAPVQPGNSGGALLDKSGNVVGVIVAQLKKGQNVNLAIKSNVAQMFLDINNIDYGVAMSKDKKEVADIADEAKGSIVQVVCHQ